MINQYVMSNNAKLDMGKVLQKVSSLPTTNLSDGDKYWYDNRIYLYVAKTSTWKVFEPKNGQHFFLEKNENGTYSGNTYTCQSGLYTNITANSDAKTVNGFVIEQNLLASAKLTDTVYDDTEVKLDISNLQTDSHIHANKTSIDKIGEDTDGHLTYNGSAIQTVVPTASTSTLGIVKPDGATITITEDGTISSTATGGTTDYTGLTNKPSINGIELSGTKTLTELGIQPSGTYLTSIPSEYITDSELTEKGYATISQIPDVSTKIESSNLKAGTNVTLSVSGNDVTINSTAPGSGGSTITDSATNGNIVVDGVEMNVYTLPSDVAKTTDIPNVDSKLEATNIKAGTNITLSVSGNDVTINSTDNFTIDSTITSTSTNAASSKAVYDYIQTNILGGAS